MTSRMSGMLSARMLATRALRAPMLSRGSTGLTNGMRRARARGVDRSDRGGSAVGAMILVGVLRGRVMRMADLRLGCARGAAERILLVEENAPRVGDMPDCGRRGEAERYPSMRTGGSPAPRRTKAVSVATATLYMASSWSEWT